MLGPDSPIERLVAWISDVLGRINLEDILTRHFAWLRESVSPTVSRSEVIFGVPLFVAFAAGLWSVWVSIQNYRAVVEGGKISPARNGGTLMTAREAKRRTLYRLLRLSVWGIVVVGLMINMPFSTVFFTYGAMLYPMIEAFDAILEIVFLVRIEEYYEQKAVRDHRAQLARQQQTILELQEKLRATTGGDTAPEASTGSA